MSNVRMCDNCGTIFSENEDGWATFSGTRRVKNPDTNRVEYKEMVKDACGQCSAQSFGEVPTPRIPLPASRKKERVQKLYDEPVVGDEPL